VARKEPAVPQLTANLVGRTILSICCSPALHDCRDAGGRTGLQIPQNYSKQLSFCFRFKIF